VREWGVLVLGAILVTLMVCVVEPTVFESLDWVRMHGFYKRYIQVSVSEGRLPLWNPHHWLGRPFMADVESAFFYPPDWLYLLLKPKIACGITIGGHLLLGQYGVLKLARALGAGEAVSVFAALIVASSPPVVGNFCWGMVHYGQALCYIPLLLYLGMRIQAWRRPQDLGLWALTFGLQVLCGHPQAAWLSLLAVLVFLGGRRMRRPVLPSVTGLGYDLGLLGSSALLGLAFAAVAVLPLLELAWQANRPGASIAFSAAFAEPKHGWATLLVPSEAPYFVVPASGQIYAGVLSFLAGICGLTRVRNPDVRALLFVALVAVILAAGAATPLFGVLFHMLPGVSLLRMHSRATVLVMLALVLAAGVFLSRPFSRRDMLLLGAVTVVSAAVSVAFCLLWPGYGQGASAIALRRACFVLLTAGLLLVWRIVDGTRYRRSARTLGVLLVLSTLADLGGAVHAQKQGNRERVPEGEEASVQAILTREGLLVPDTPPPRVFLPQLRENAGMERGWSTPYGYSALALRRVWSHLHGVLGVPAPVSANTFPSYAIERYGAFPYDSMALVLGSRGRGGTPLFNPRPDPRAYLVTAARRVRDSEEATAWMRGGHDFHRTALVEGAVGLPDAPGLGLESQADEAHATIVHFAPERIVVATKSAAPALLVLAEPWYPGWSARVNGTPAPCLPVNAWMRGVSVPAGTSEVVVTFQSTYLLPGLLISVVALIAALVLALRRPGGRRRQVEEVLEAAL
jgi:hypothetical protein